MKHVLRGCMLAAAMLMALPGLAQAADLGDFGDLGMHPYIGAGVGVYNINFQGSGINQSNNMAGGFAKLGVDLNEFLGAELRIGGTDIKGGTPSQPLKQRARYLFSYLAKLQLPFTQQFRIYGLIGGTTGNLNANLGGTQLAGKVATGVSFGGGIDYQVDDFTSVDLEYMRYWNHLAVNKLGTATGTADVESYVFAVQFAM